MTRGNFYTQSRQQGLCNNTKFYLVECVSYLAEQERKLFRQTLNHWIRDASRLPDIISLVSRSLNLTNFQVFNKLKVFFVFSTELRVVINIITRSWEWSHFSSYHSRRSLNWNWELLAQNSMRALSCFREEIWAFQLGEINRFLHAQRL